MKDLRKSTIKTTKIKMKGNPVATKSRLFSRLQYGRHFMHTDPRPGVIDTVSCLQAAYLISSFLCLSWTSLKKKYLNAPLLKMECGHYEIRSDTWGIKGIQALDNRSNVPVIKHWCGRIVSVWWVESILLRLLKVSCYFSRCILKNIPRVYIL